MYYIYELLLIFLNSRANNAHCIERKVLLMSVYEVPGCGVVENVEVYGFDESVRGAKYPKSVDISSLNSDLTDGIKALAMSPAGAGHDQWLTGVVVQFDLKLSIKAWVEAERYGHLDFVSSQSTMHKISTFDIAASCNEYVDPRIAEILMKKVQNYNNFEPATDEERKLKAEKYLGILYNVPAGFTLVARMTTNYRQLKTIYHQRRFHRLPEWRTLCKWIETELPHSYLITGEEW